MISTRRVWCAFLDLRNSVGGPPTKEAIDPARRMHRDDPGVMDEHGTMTITGRSKDMVIFGGDNICPREIEASGSGLDATPAAGMAGLAVLRMAA